jgi:hypothetical protein
MLRCAILSASKMQVYPTVGDCKTTFKGCGLTIAELLRGHPSFLYFQMDILLELATFYKG